MRKPPYFDGMSAEPEPVKDISGARVLALLGDSVTTDHISPAEQHQAGHACRTVPRRHGVERKEYYNSFGSRRGNHEVMIRGTFANIRLRNQLLARCFAADTPVISRNMMGRRRLSTMRRKTMRHNIPLVVLGGKEYGSGSSRDWAAKGTALLGVRAVITESFERIHRSNLIGMGVIPLQFPEGKRRGRWGWTVPRLSTSPGSKLNDGKTPKTVHVKASKDGGADAH